ncbi:sporulation membrane protein YtaF [Clostridium sp. Cult1]|uniref:sporulation membrane protein YtaF n=1 Tax=Clostridium sp. Cult1 TaxID=2079002 RepID=UPI001F01134B|nr:sporulation membrane protein YtaF [Clostridium sp. Cult1]MCF6463407.1 sporulation membrane protein YtaF [Clostridium sp. Cult1]
MEALMLVLALSLDAFVASFAYGANKIEIPFTSIIIIDLVCVFFLAISVFFGELVKCFLSDYVTSIFGFLILFFLGVFYLFESIIKTYFKNKITSRSKVKVKLFDIWLIIDIYVDEIKADFDNSKRLNSREALYLAVALSLDSLAIGFSSGLGNINILLIIFMSFIFHILTIWSGLLIGKKFAEKSKINLSWITGILLICLAFLKLK